MAKKSLTTDTGNLYFKKESDLRKSIVKSIRAAGGFAQPIESTTAAGIPDIYITLVGDRGGWVECKILRKGSRKIDLTARQFKWLLGNWRAGSWSWLAIYDEELRAVLFYPISSSDQLHIMRDSNAVRSYCITAGFTAYTKQELDYLIANS